MAMTPWFSLPGCIRRIIRMCASCSSALHRQEARGLPPHGRSDVDFVLTFEEMQGIFDAKRGSSPPRCQVDPEEEFGTGTALDAALPSPAAWPTP